MSRKGLLFGFSILFAFSCAAMASLVDPGMVIDSGDPNPIPISTGINTVAANGITDPLTFDFVNDLNQIIIGFTFQTTVAPHLTSPNFFSCSSGYFLHCEADYNSTTGNLEYIFSGVHPSDHDEACGHDIEHNEKEGIPLCGKFHITLTGWTNATGLYDDTHRPGAFINTVEAVPEPSSVFMVLTGLLLLAGVAELRRRRQLRPTLNEPAVPHTAC
jgi:hypothetical protein